MGANAAAALGRGVSSVVGSGNADKAVAIAAAINAKAEAAAAAAASRGKDYCKLLNHVIDLVAEFFARSAVFVFVLSLLAFCLSAGLLSFTENNKDFHNGGFPRANTRWRQALTILVLLASLLSFHAIFLRHHNVLNVMGLFVKVCACCLFVVASFDQDYVTDYCLHNDLCVFNVGSGNSTKTVYDWDPASLNSLEAGPAIDYITVFFWLISGLVVAKRGDMIKKEIQDAELQSKMYNEMQASATAYPPPTEAYPSYTGATMPGSA